jgi:host factor-I protein
MNKSSGNLQDLFLNYVRKENIPVTIYLVNSVQLRGAVRGFDPFTILLETPGRPMQMVYKSAVTSIVPMRAVYMRGADTNPRGEASEASSEGPDAGEGQEQKPAPDAGNSTDN